MKNQEKAEPPAYYNTITNFRELRDAFGEIWSRWKDKREAFGPGIYLFLSTRRGMPMYVEHIFVSLVFGLEALHRRRGGQEMQTLGQKLSDIFGGLPVGLDVGRLREFCNACARRRNDIAHYGGDRHASTYSDFLADVNKKGKALSILYHALLLNELGISEQTIKRWMFDSFRAGPIKAHLVEAGLLDPSVLKPAA
jgi:ApeA N-terminal domain 1